jgi:CHASE2 domain-containing sensor protein
MDISPTEAEEALDAIQSMTQKTRHSIASSGVHISLIITGIVWLVGFMATQFLPGEIVPYIWIGVSILGAILGSVLSMRLGKRMRSPTASATAKRIGTVWLLLGVYCLAAIAITWPLDGKQLTVLVVLFVLVGWLVMGLLLSITSIWPGLIIMALVLIGYFLLSDYFYLWMGILGGGGMIALGLYIRYRW